MEYKVNVGDKIPRFRIKDNEGFEVASDDLLGSPFVLYFYPKDGTPGCTKEACSFRDTVDELDLLDTLVIGISPDSVESHEKFIKDHNLNFTLLCDESCELARQFGAMQEKEVGGKLTKSVERTTFLIDANGVIRWIERPVNVEGHAERVLQEVRKIVSEDHELPE